MTKKTAKKAKTKTAKRKKARKATGKALPGHSAMLEDLGVEFMGDADRDALDWTNNESRKLPEPGEVLEPFGWKILVMPMRRESITKGGIILAQVTQDTDMYLNYIGRIVAVGPLAYRHSKYADMGLAEKDYYQRGDWVVYPIYQYARIDFKGVKLILLNDDSFLGRLPEGVSPWDFKVER